MKNSQYIIFIMMHFVFVNCGSNNKTHFVSAAVSDGTSKTGDATGSSLVIIKRGSNQPEDINNLSKLKELIGKNHFENFLKDRQLTADMKFSERRENEQSIDRLTHAQHSRLTMRGSEVSESKTMQQASLKEHIEIFKQGKEGHTETEYFQQTPKGSGVLDILIVVDNSLSMREEQKNLATKLKPLLSHIVHSDWQIAFVSTTQEETAIHQLLKKGEYDQVLPSDSRKFDTREEEVFSQAINMGIGGSQHEKGIARAIESLKSGWVREGSTLAILFLTDANNCTNGHTGCTLEERDPNSLLRYLQSVNRTIKQDARIYGILASSMVDSKQCRIESLSQQYKYLVKKSHGHAGSICDDDYTQTLKHISENISTILKNSFNLKKTPSPKTISVLIEHQAWKEGKDFHVDGKTLVFDRKMSPGVSITVSYKHDYLPTFDRVKLPYPVTNKAWIRLIEVSGRPLSEFDFDPNTNEVIFTQDLADNETGKIYYRPHADTLKKVFEIQLPASYKNLRVYDGTTELLMGTEVNYQNNQLIFYERPPLPDAKIKLTYHFLKPILSYPYRLPEGFSMKIFDGKEEISFSLEENNVLFDKEDYQEGRQLNIVTLPIDSIKTPLEKIPLGIIPIPETVRLIAGDKECTANNGLSFDNKDVVDITKCDIPSEVQMFRVVYQYIHVNLNEYAFDKSFFQKPHTYQIWEVSQGNKYIINYNISKNRLIFKKNHPIGQTHVAVSLIDRM